MMEHLLEQLLAAGLAFGATHGLARLAPRIGWVDAPVGVVAGRKLQDRPVPPVGGVALALVLAALPWTRGLVPPWGWIGLALLLGVGVLDDLRAGGLGPLAKLGGQALALAPLVLALRGWPTGAGDLALLLGALALGLLALNLTNTFDHADGALVAALLPGVLLASPVLLGPLVGFAGANLDGRRGERGFRAPSAYLGDAGAFLLGALVLAEPRLLGVLFLPLLDLGRLSVLRWRAGSAPWVGDRRHLGHRLARRGFSPRRGALLIGLIGAPAGIGVALQQGYAPALGALGTGLLYLGALAFTANEGLRGARLACPEAGPGE